MNLPTAQRGFPRREGESDASYRRRCATFRRNAQRVRRGGRK